MPYNSIAVANYFVQRALAIGDALTPMKLLKLVYIAHGWNLGLNRTPLLNEGVEAWKFGPVVPSVYHAFKHYGSSRIAGFWGTDIVTDSSIIPLLDKVWEVYRPYNGLQLSSMTHNEGTPWDTVVKPYGANIPNCLPIPNDIIENYYSTLARQNATTSA